jgi:hypothetical protein
MNALELSRPGSTTAIPPFFIDRSNEMWQQAPGRGLLERQGSERQASGAACRGDHKWTRELPFAVIGVWEARHVHDTVCHMQGETCVFKTANPRRGSCVQ